MNFSLLFFSFFFVFCHSLKLHQELGVQEAFSLKANLNFTGAEEGKNVILSNATMEGIFVRKCLKKLDDGCLYISQIFFPEMSHTGRKLEAMSSHRINELGTYFYFAQNSSGEIGLLYFEQDEILQDIQVKISSVHALQTYLDGGENDDKWEKDPFGEHRSTYSKTVLKNGDIFIEKNFTEKAFQQFSNGALDTTQLKMISESKILLDQSGSIKTAYANQFITFRLNVGIVAKFNNGSALKLGMNSTSEIALNFNSSQANKYPLPNEIPSGLNQMISGTLMDFASPSSTAHASTLKLKTSNERKQSTIDAKFPVLFKTLISSKNGKMIKNAQIVSYLKIQKKLVSFFTPATEARLINTYLVPVLKSGDANGASHVFKLIVEVANKIGMSSSMENLFLQYGFSQINAQVRMKAYVSLHMLKSVPTSIVLRMMSLLQEEERKSSTASERGMLLLAFASCTKKMEVSDVAIAAQSKALLLHEIESNLALYLEFSCDVKRSLLINAIHALGNSNPQEIPSILVTLFRMEDGLIRRAVVQTISKISAAKEMLSIGFADRDARVRSAARRALQRNFLKEEPSSTIFGDQYDPLPLNATIAHTIEFGDSVTNILFQAEAFTGTNWNCDKQDFNYEVLVDVANFIDIYGFHVEPFTAEVIYGKLNSVSLSDIISVTVMRDVIYYLKLDGDQCNPVVDILDTLSSPHLEQKYTLWGFPVPITFKADESGIAEIGVGYEICDTELTATIELDPGLGSAFEFFSEFEMNSFRSGISIGTSLAVDLVPNSFVDFSNCKAGVSLSESLHPSKVIIDGEIQLRQCTWAHHHWTDCHWGEELVDELGEYVLKGYRQIIEEKEWDIPH